VTLPETYREGSIKMPAAPRRMTAQRVDPRSCAGLRHLCLADRPTTTRHGRDERARVLATAKASPRRRIPDTPGMAAYHDRSHDPSVNLDRVSAGRTLACGTLKE
jgi:hypothetical protein